MDRMLKYLVQQNGMESTEKLVEAIWPGMRTAA